MLKQLLKGSSVFVFLLAGNLSAIAQVPASKPQIQLSQGLQAQLQLSQVQTTVSQEELQKFASVLPTLQEIGQTSQQMSVQIIEESGLSVERFQELSEAQQSPGAEPSSPATPEEQQSFNQIAPEIESIQQETLTKQEEAVRAGGLEPNRFNEIVIAIQQDPALQQQVQQLIQNN
ncbi:DUF4168 domain-containing protein [Nodularia sphaerocarpa]|uniref:DUF4168 domain-containing protein n=1 Tax=Nodularia sphaerocarpa TaxID=137816 RepID=UPI001EFA7C5F|nr:DUF4168 domain-containing protein [Nodularia sphaerocarpa]MDB9371962.1 DUF4168 domain-containing protein [Nodularia sphaerocarpa CS-585]MDB9380409.1 DUF4168 domain-containing protein [Nodularia sphaerocarpa CS-585A2]ULP74755.1 hypothetical protein BDGGKGIB_04425 [Nodularia sphaerocarpa UHCC 0038]